jgi:hypothetical protein
MELLIMKFSPLPRYLIPPRPKYSPQHPILKHPQSMFLPQFQQPSFTPTASHQHYYSILLLLFNLLKPTDYVMHQQV